MAHQGESTGETGKPYRLRLRSTRVGNTVRDAHGLASASEAAAEHLQQAGEVKVVAHIDADGLCSAAIASRALIEADVDHEVTFVKNLGEQEAGELLDEDPECVWFVDLGSGAADNFLDKPWVITDHHDPQGQGPEHHVNAHFFGIDGSKEVSGAGLTWGVARNMVSHDIAGELAATAVVGAVGDLQSAERGRLVGVNRGIVAEAAHAGTIEPLRDLSLYGRETRELHKFFQYADNPAIPGVSGSSTAAIQFLAENEVRRTGPDGLRRAWVHLDHDEKQRLASAAARRILAAGNGSARANGDGNGSGSAPEASNGTGRGGGYKDVWRLFGEVYQLPNEQIGTQLHDAKEFATLLNSTARYDRADVGLALAMGDRDQALEESADLMKGHRRALVQGMNMVLDEGLERMGHLQYFHGGDRIRDTIVGIVAGMLSGKPATADDAIMVGFANRGDHEVKVSCRAPKRLVNGGLNLAEAIQIAAQATGGEGGGHAGAAGATIPKGKEPDFLGMLDTAVGRQLGTRF